MCVVYLQAVGLVVAAGDFVEGLTIGRPVAAMSFGAYAEFTVVRTPGAKLQPNVFLTYS